MSFRYLWARSIALHMLRVAILKKLREVEALQRLRFCHFLCSYVNGNLNAPCIMIGEKAADLIK